MRLRALLLPVVANCALGVIWFALPANARIKQPATWQRLAIPGALSQPHAFLANDCAACHVPVEGATRSKCVLCHANETALLQRQPTSFHASISSCVECHSEHQGRQAVPTSMDHAAIALIGMDELQTAARPEADTLRAWLRITTAGDSHSLHPAGDAAPSLPERVLDCRTCHSREDQHFGLLGKDCVACHATSSWTLAAFTHPSPQSRDCAQCHQAPPSHYMGHFKMVSAAIARKPHASVNQCFECHRTTAWTDIPGVGHYKHH